MPSQKFPEKFSDDKDRQKKKKKENDEYDDGVLDDEDGFLFDDFELDGDFD